jgi:hypothetical protein
MIMKKITLLLIGILSALNINAEVYEGSCGNNVSYSLDTSTGVIVITGTGEMSNYTTDPTPNAPWYYLRSYIKSVEVSNGVTTIGKRAFYGCSGLTSVTIPNSVTSIGSGAFQSCSGLTSITIPNSVTSIGSEAFLYCSGLTSITIPNSVTSIGSYAFRYCSGLTSVNIPNSVTSIGESAFQECSNLTEISLSDKLSTIGTGVFVRCTRLESVTIPKSVTSIGYNAFAGCTNLKSVIISEGLLEIQDMAFYGCTSLKSIILPNSLNKLSSSVFSGCSSLESLNFPPKVRTISSAQSFNNCLNLKTIIIEDSPDTLFFEVFSRSDSNPKWFPDSPLDSLYIGRNIKYEFYESGYRYYSPFREFETLRAVKFGDNVSYLSDNYLKGCKNLKSVYLSKNISSIGNYAFYGCNNLQSIEFGSKLETIGIDAFAECNSLKKIVIPSNVTSIGACAFRVGNLSELIIEEGEKDINLIRGGAMGDYMFSGSSIDSVFWGRNGAAINYKNIKHLEIGNISNFKKVGSPSYETKGCDTIKVLSIKTSSDTLHFVVEQYSWQRKYTLPFNHIHIDSIYWDRIIDIYDPYNTGRTFYPLEGVNSSFKLTIGNNITSISNNMFAECNISSILIPKNIKKIGSTSFKNCYTLSELIFEDSPNPIDFEEGNNFLGCQLRNVYIGRNMNFSTNSPFNGNKEGIQKLTFGNSVSEIPNNAFNGLKNVKDLTLPQNLKTIGSMAFYGCNGLAELTIPGSVTEIGRQAFDLCNNLKTLRLDDGKELLKFTAEPNYLNNAFQNSPLEEVYIGRNFSFNNSSPLAIFGTMKSLTFGEEVLSIQARSFIGCPNLKDVTSYSKVVPTTNDIVFTPSYQTNATLHVPYALYDEYKVANVWKDFGTIVNFEGLYNLVYNVDGEEYKKYIVEQGTSITPEAEPTKEGYIFSGWSEIPTTMPAKDVVVTGTFTIDTTGIDDIYSDDDNKEYYTIDGVRIAQPKKGFNIVKMSDGSIKKIFIK